MLRRFTAICLLAAMFGANCTRFFVYVGFETNQKYIAENLCVNKDKKWMHCNGKCYLMKKIHQAEENEKKQADRDNLSRIELSFFEEPFTLSLFAPVVDDGETVFAPYTCQFSASFIDTIFIPPRLTA